MDKKRNAYMDLIRAVACILVIGGHISGYNWEDTSVNTFKYHVLNISDNICALGVPLFIMLSGALHLNPSYKLTFKSLFKKKVFRLLVVYYFWLTYYNIFNFIENGYELSFFNIKFYILGRIVRGEGIYHLWFIPKLIILYLITPFIKDALKNKAVTIYAMIVFATVVLFVPTLFQFDFPMKEWIVFNFDMEAYQTIAGFFCYLGYYIAGHFVHTFIPDELNIKGKLAAYSAVIVGTGGAIISGATLTKHFGIADARFMNPTYIFLFLSGTGLFILFKQWGKVYEEKGVPKWIAEIAGLSLGIYLIHPTVIKFFPYFNISILSPQPYIMIPLMTLVVTAISFGLSFLLNKIPVLKKWIL